MGITRTASARGVSRGLSILGFLWCLVASITSPASVSGKSEIWNPTIPRGHSREIDFITSEGTWMSLDISPDGKWIVFDLLGHIYRVRVTGGGEAECLTQNS